MEAVVCVFAHPDDIAYGMGGLALLLKRQFKLHLVCATKGERGLPGRGDSETAAIRQEEEKKEAAALGASLTFLGRIDAELFADEDVCRQVAEIVRETNPIALFTLWPVDNHPDHSAVSEIARKALSLSEKAVELVYFEAGEDQTELFAPAVYVDVSAIMDKKLELIRGHKCQNPEDHLAQMALRNATRRGGEAGCSCAEGYISLPHPDSGGMSVFSNLKQARRR